MQKRDWKKEIFTIPNMLSFFRLVLIPVYICIYLNATELKDYWVAAGVLAISCLTDMFDGMIARKFNMISNFGKVLDPMADKFTQLSLIVCLSKAFPALNGLLILFLFKETFQLVAMLMYMRKGLALNGALLSGKISTTILFTALTFLILNPDLSEGAMWIITGISAMFMLIAFVDYIRAYYGKNNKLHNMEDM